MATLKNTTIASGLALGNGRTFDRPNVRTVIEQFTTVGNNSWTCPAGVTEVEALVVGGGGAGGYGHGAGGGAGAVLHRLDQPVTPGQTYTFTVGAGGARTTSNSSINNGDPTTAFGVTATGGGCGANEPGDDTSGRGGVGSNGANGGGGGYGFRLGGSGVAPVASGWTVYAGNDGGRGGSSANANYPEGGGGGAGEPGYDASTGSTGGNAGGAGNQGGGGGNGVVIDILGYPLYWGGGGGGCTYNTSGTPGGGGLGGGGGGSNQSGSQPGAGGTNALNDGETGFVGSDVRGGDAGANTGGGGGGSANENGQGGAGGSGIVVLRYYIADNTDPIGSIRYNNDINAFEVYENHQTGWVSQDPEMNFAGHNLYAQRADLTSGWTSVVRSTITATTETVAPDGSETAYKWVEDTSTNQHFAYISQSYSAGSIYCQSIYVKPINSRYITLAHASRVVFDLQEGTIDSSADTGFVNGGIIDVGNGWYRIYSATVASSITSYVFHYPNNWQGESVPSYTGSTSKGYYIWGHQLEKDVITPGPWTPTYGNPSPTPVNVNGYNIHRYINSGSASSFSPANTGTVEVLVVAGGGSGGNCQGNSGTPGGGGGAGGVIHRREYAVKSGQTYRVVVGAGGAAQATANVGGLNGNNSQFGTLVAIGGGGGGGDNASSGWGADTPNRRWGFNGGCGGGASNGANGAPGTVGQGFEGGLYGTTSHAGGGGGAGEPGGYTYVSTEGGRGGTGYYTDISGQFEYYGGGGGAGGRPGATSGEAGGLGGGGRGADNVTGSTSNATPGTPNTGGGGGGGAANQGSTSISGAGGSGIVIVRYKNQKTS